MQTMDVAAEDYSKSTKNIVLIEGKLKEIIQQQMDAYNWKLENIELKVIKVTLENSHLEIDYHVFIEHTLNYSHPNESPAVKGRLSLLETLMSEKNPDDNVIKYVQSDIKQWEERIQNYINNTQEAEEYFKVKVSLNEDNSLKYDTLEIYYDNVDKFVPIDEMITPIDNEKISTNSYNDLLSDVLEFKQTLLFNNPPLYDYYDGNKAVAYANKWVTNTLKHCGDGVTLQDTSYYNPAYTNYGCNDCANFVSQSLKAGGIPENTYWNPDTMTWYNTGWSNNFYGLKDYMVDKGYATVTTYSNSKPGDFVMYNSYSHVMLVVYNDGSTVKISAHSSDRKNTAITSSDKTFYSVKYLLPYTPE